MKKNCLFIVFLFLQLGLHVQAQGFSIEIGGPGDHNAADAQGLPNGETLVLGAERGIPNPWDGRTLLFRLDEQGNEISRTVPAGLDDGAFFRLVPGENGHFWLVGTLYYPVSRAVPMIAEIDDAGNLFQRIHFELSSDSSEHAFAMDMDQLPDGGYLLTVVNYPAPSGTFEQNLLAIDADGTLRWSRTDSLEMIHNPIATDVFEDGGFVTASSVQAINGTPNSSYLSKSTANGSIEWGRFVYSCYGQWVVRSVAVTRDQNIMLVGNVSENPDTSRAIVMVLDQQGNLIRERLIEVGGWDISQFSSLRRLKDGTMAAGGLVYDIGHDEYVYLRGLLCGLGPDGDLLWTCLPESPSDSRDYRIEAISETPTGQILATGYSSAQQGIDFDTEGYVALSYCGSDRATLAFEESEYTAYPNPSPGELFIVPTGKGECKFTAGQHTVELYDLAGRRIVVPYQISFYKVSVDMSTLARGMYILRLREGEKELLTQRVERL